MAPHPEIGAVGSGKIMALCLQHLEEFQHGANDKTKGSL